MTSDAKEPFLPNHRGLDDATLLRPPEHGPLTPLTLFVCTYVATLGNLHMNFVALTRRLCARPRGSLLAVNSNFGHAAQPGYEHYLKTPKPPPERRTPSRGRARKFQGDGTCFNSAVEPVVAIDHPGIDEDKVYFTKCFPSTGETQVPGVVCPDLSDGHVVLEAFVAQLNELSVGDLEFARTLDVPSEPEQTLGPEFVPVKLYQYSSGRGPGGAGIKLLKTQGFELVGGTDLWYFRQEPTLGPPELPAGEIRLVEGQKPLYARRKKVVILREQPKMINYKFRVVRNSPRILINLSNLAKYLRELEFTKASVSNPLPALQEVRFHGWPAIVLPPFPVRETKPPTDDVKVSFRFQGANRAPRVNVFQEGKINILGADTVESAELIYAYFVRLFTANWQMLICLQPRRDIERRQAARALPPKPAPAPPPPPPPAPLAARFTDTEIEEILREHLGLNDPYLGYLEARALAAREARKAFAEVHRERIDARLGAEAPASTPASTPASASASVSAPASDLQTEAGTPVKALVGTLVEASTGTTGPNSEKATLQPTLSESVLGELIVDAEGWDAWDASEDISSEEAVEEVVEDETGDPIGPEHLQDSVLDEVQGEHVEDD
jgi:hypothetical protein